MLVGNMAGVAFAEVAVPVSFAVDVVPAAFVADPGVLLIRISAHE